MTLAERQWVPDSLLGQGTLAADGSFDVTDTSGGEVARFASAAEFRSSLLAHVRLRADAAIQSLF